MPPTRNSRKTLFKLISLVNIDKTIANGKITFPRLILKLNSKSPYGNVENVWIPGKTPYMSKQSKNMIDNKKNFSILNSFFLFSCLMISSDSVLYSSSSV